MRYPPHLLDEIRARLPVSSVVGRKLALKKAGREFRGLSPFKAEKTPSFFVNDQKGFYHCFASGEHGDIFTFLMKVEGLTFPEAVERLAEEAGVTLPKPVPTPRAAAEEDARVRYDRLMTAAAAYFEERLHSAAGRDAAAYLERRGLSRATIERFRLGFAPNSRTSLAQHLAAAGFSRADMIATGMMIAGEDIPEPYDRFRNRVMFPITDLRGRIIAFGGRALDPSAPAKYLNSPETVLFHKGHILFNAANARRAAHEKGRVLVVEGYMDVISLAQAGFEEAVAPLGTALTEDQLALVWRMAAEPLLCFDGDGAGVKAAHRAVDTALPHLKPGTSLSFAFLPDGLDPDDLVRNSGPAAFEQVLARARPLSEVLFEREWAAGDWSTPERRAALELQLRKLVAGIADASVRSHYERIMRERLFAAWRSTGSPSQRPFPSRRQGPGGSEAARARPGAGNGPAQRGERPRNAPEQAPKASASLRRSALVAGGQDGVPLREALIVRTLLNHPWLVEEHAEELAELELASADLAALRDAMLSASAQEKSLDRDDLRSHLTRLGLDKSLRFVERSTTHRCDKFAEPDADPVEVTIGFRHALTLHESLVGLKRSLRAAEKAWHEDGSEASLERIYDINRRMAELMRPDGTAEEPSS